MDMTVDGTRRGDQAVRHDRRRMRPDLELDPVADRRVAGPPDPDDPALLDSDVGLDDPDRWIDQKRPGDDGIQLGVRRAARLGHPRPERLPVAPDRLVAASLAVVGHLDPEVSVGQSHPVAGRRAIASESFGRIEHAGHRSAVEVAPVDPA
jgi:hypothetical protein